MKRVYEGKCLENISYPLGGIGAGMVCIEGTGAFGSVSVRHRPDLYNEPYMYAALTVIGRCSKVLEGPVPEHKIWGAEVKGFNGAGNGLPGRNYGLPRFRRCRFYSEFPFATIELEDEKVPVRCRIKAFSPFIPGDEDDSSLPFAASCTSSSRSRGLKARGAVMSVSVGSGTWPCASDSKITAASRPICSLEVTRERSQ